MAGGSLIFTLSQHGCIPAASRPQCGRSMAQPDRSAATAWRGQTAVRPQHGQPRGLTMSWSGLLLPDACDHTAKDNARNATFEHDTSLLTTYSPDGIK